MLVNPKIRNAFNLTAQASPKASQVTVYRIQGCKWGVCVPECVLYGFKQGGGGVAQGRLSPLTPLCSNVASTNTARTLLRIGSQTQMARLKIMKEKVFQLKYSLRHMFFKKCVERHSF